MNDQYIAEQICNILKDHGFDAMWQMIDFDEEKGTGRYI